MVPHILAHVLLPYLADNSSYEFQNGTARIINIDGVRLQKLMAISNLVQFGSYIHQKMGLATTIVTHYGGTDKLVTLIHCVWH